MTMSAFFAFKTKEEILNALRKVDSLVSINGTLQVSGQIGGTPYLIDGQNLSFWTEIFNTILLQKYETISYVISPQNIIWWGKKIKK